jgi:hypothetical protein
MNEDSSLFLLFCMKNNSMPNSSDEDGRLSRSCHLQIIGPAQHGGS